MRRLLVAGALLALAGSTVAIASTALAGSMAPGARDRAVAPLHRGASYFAVFCGFSHRNDDDPIVFPREVGRSHNHTFFGNRATNASSTAASLRASNSTTCRLAADTAAYWAPTLLVAGRAVEPRGAIVYYVRRTLGRVRPFPAGLQIVAGSAAARSPQSLRVTYWSCGRGVRASSTVPTCASDRRGESLRLVVSFPNCWDGRRLDSADHASHMAYSDDGSCPESHPVAVPALTLLIGYPVAGGSAELSSGGQFSGHADFVNAWDQDVLSRLVDRYLNRRR